MITEIRKPRMVNTSRILRAIWTSRRISRIRLARELGLNKSTVTTIVSELMESGIVHETDEISAGPSGGRRPVQIELRRRFGYVLGLEIRAESYTAAAVDLGGDILFSRTEDIDCSAENFADVMNDLLRRIPDELSWIGTPLLGAGVGLSGIVDSGRGVIIGSIPLRTAEAIDFARDIGENFSFPVYVENDANACAWGELTFHRTKRLRNFIFTLVEFHKRRLQAGRGNTSLGFGIVFEGKVYHGGTNSAGEFKSLFCGAEDRGQCRVSYLENGMEKEPDKLRELIEEIAGHLGLFVNTFNLEQVFLGGDIEGHQEEVTPILREAINANWVYDEPVQCDIRFSSLGDKSVAYGAAGMLLERLFMDPDAMEFAVQGSRDGMGAADSKRLLERGIKAS